jgi:outer membrane lipoprotein-sorting protein
MGLCLVASLPSAASAVEAPEGTGAEQARVRRLIQKIESQSVDVRSLSASLVQEKHLALFDQPLILRGKLYVQKPDRFAFRIDTPLRYTMVIAGEKLRQWDEDSAEVQTISLAENPGFKLVLRQMRGWLSGSYSSMLGEYDATILQEDPIELAFVPLANALAYGTVERVRVAFDSDARHLREIEILDRQGDRTVFQFADVRINADIDPSAWEAKPRVE